MSKITHNNIPDFGKLDKSEEQKKIDTMLAWIGATSIEDFEPEDRANVTKAIKGHSKSAYISVDDKTLISWGGFKTGFEYGDNFPLATRVKPYEKFQKLTEDIREKEFQKWLDQNKEYLDKAESNLDAQIISNDWKYAFMMGVRAGRKASRTNQTTSLEDIRDSWRQSTYPEEVEQIDRDRRLEDETQLEEWYGEGYQAPKRLSIVKTDEKIKEAHYEPAKFELESPLEPGSPKHEFFRKNYDYTGENHLEKIKRKLKLLQKELKGKPEAKEIADILKSPNMQVA